MLDVDRQYLTVRCTENVRGALNHESLHVVDFIVYARQYHIHREIGKRPLCIWSSITCTACQ